MTPLPIKRDNPKACDFCGMEKIVMLTLANGVQICSTCRRNRETPTP